MKLGLILILVALLVPTVLWLVWGDGWDIVIREGYEPGQTLTRIAQAMGDNPSKYVRPPVLLPLRYVLAGSALCFGVGVYLLATRKPRQPDKEGI